MDEGGGAERRAEAVVLPRPRQVGGVQARYWRELDGNPEVEELLELARRGDVTLLYAARSPHNNAEALREYLERRLAERRGGPP